MKCKNIHFLKIISFIKGGSLRATTNGDTGTYTFEWNAEGSGDLLMMTLPHHRQILANGMEVPEIRLNGLKGEI